MRLLWQALIALSASSLEGQIKKQQPRIGQGGDQILPQKTPKFAAALPRSKHQKKEKEKGN